MPSITNASPDANTGLLTEPIASTPCEDEVGTNKLLDVELSIYTIRGS